MSDFLDNLVELTPFTKVDMWPWEPTKLQKKLDSIGLGNLIPLTRIEIAHAIATFAKEERTRQEALYTPIHQAAFSHDTKEVVSHLKNPETSILRLALRDKEKIERAQEIAKNLTPKKKTTTRQERKRKKRYS